MIVAKPALTAQEVEALPYAEKVQYQLKLVDTLYLKCRESHLTTDELNEVVNRLRTELRLY